MRGESPEKDNRSQIIYVRLQVALVVGAVIFCAVNGAWWLSLMFLGVLMVGLGALRGLNKKREKIRRGWQEDDPKPPWAM